MDRGTSTRRSSWPAPEILFVILASLGGLILVAMIPPMGGGNEYTNFQRAASLATGHALVGPAPLPGGIADFLTASSETFPEGRNPPYSYSREDFEKLASIPLRSDQPAIVQPNPIAVLHPLSYLPQVPAIAIGQWLGLSPLILLYLGRLAGLASGVALTLHAIRIMPVGRSALAAIALLPTILFTRSTLDADQFTNGLAFLFLALTFREIGRSSRIEPGSVAAIAVTAFLLAQCKSAYLLLPLLALAIPAERFVSARSRALFLALIVMPGVIGSFAWMLLLKHSYFSGLEYTTWSGTVRPDAQLALVLSDPFGYAWTLIRTVFATPFIPKSLIEFIGVFGPPVMMPVIFYPLLAILVGAAIIASRDPAAAETLRTWSTRMFALALALVTVAIILSLLYLQWTRYQSPVVEGFSGRYLYPLVPLLLIFLPAGRQALFGRSAGFWLCLLGLVSIGGTWWVTWSTYWA